MMIKTKLLGIVPATVLALGGQAIADQPLRDAQGAPAPGNIGQTGRSRASRAQTVTVATTTNKPNHRAATAVRTVAAAQSKPTTAAQRAAALPAVAQPRTQQLVAQPIRQTSTAPGGPLRTNRGEPAPGNCMSKAGCTRGTH